MNHPTSTRRLVIAIPSIVAVLLLAGGASSSRGANGKAGLRPHPDSSAAIAAVERFHSALAAGDTTAALALLAPDAIILESGVIETRQDYRAHHLAADAEFGKALKSIRSPLKATVQGDVVWVAGTSTTSGKFKGRKIDSAGAELMVLTRTNASWTIRAIHWSSHSHRPAT